MNFFRWISSKLGKNQFNLDEMSQRMIEYGSELHIRELAFWSAVNIISSAVAKCEFKTYTKGKEIKSDEYYLWNMEPNKNQNSSEFIHEWISKLYVENECLIISERGELFIVDSFDKNGKGFDEITFTNLVVNGKEIEKTYKQSKVMYFKLASKDMKRLLNSLYESYSKMIFHGMASYNKSRGTKGVFEYDTLPIAGTDEREAFDELIKTKFKTFMDSSDAIIPLGRGQKFTEVGSKTYANESTRDVRAMIDDIFDFTAKGFTIPPALLKGDAQGVEEVLDLLLTFCIDPLVKMLAEEINRKRIGLKYFKEGTRVVIDTQTIKHIDIFNITTSIEKLISSGCFSVNKVLKMLGRELIDESWADEHFMTKNYANLKEFIEGG